MVLVGFIIVQEVGLRAGLRVMLTIHEHAGSLRRVPAPTIAKLHDLPPGVVADVLHVRVVNELLLLKLIAVGVHVHLLGTIGTRPWHDETACRLTNCVLLHSSARLTHEQALSQSQQQSLRVVRQFAIPIPQS